MPPDSVSARDRAGLTEAFENARALEESDPTASRARYESIVAGHPWFAEAHFRLARLLEAARDNDAARRHYTLARDRDGFPIRVTTAFAQIYRDVAARSGCILVDGPEVLRPLTPRGILDGHAIHDAHHPTLASHVALARAVLEHLRTRHFLGWRGDEVRVSPTECATHFGVDRETWEMVCAKSATFYRHFAHARYDPSERLTRMRRFEEAGLRIASGVPPERTGIAGLGIPTP